MDVLHGAAQDRERLNALTIFLYGALAGPFFDQSDERTVGSRLSQDMRCTCGSGFSREESNAVPGTGCAGVRG
ncbi:integral membrane protein TerC [Pseudomonas putida S11]|nr:integral membrane protein TerC [Pseudomonas putida S11]